MSDELLTTREVERLVRLNRVTIYRLIREGEFPAIKVGGQWRFPRSAIEAWLAKQASVNLPAPSPEEGVPPLADLFSDSELRPVLKAFAEATGLSIAILDTDDQPVIECLECSPFCKAVQGTPQGAKACRESRIHPAEAEHGLLICHAGLHYLTAPIEIEEQPVARVLMGPFVRDEVHLETIRQSLPDVAHRIGADAHLLLEHLHQVQRLTPEQVNMLLRLLSRVINTMVRLAYNRRKADQRLKEIARLASSLE